MTEKINLSELRERAESVQPDKTRFTARDVLALIDAVEAARQLVDDLDDAIAGAELEAWNAPYRIEAPLFRDSSDRTRSALHRFDFRKPSHSDQPTGTFTMPPGSQITAEQTKAFNTLLSAGVDPEVVAAVAGGTYRRLTQSKPTP